MKAYWFAFNPADWLSSKSVRMMSKCERGSYITLLATAWGEEQPGTLPVSEDMVRRLAEMSPEEWAISGPCLLAMFPVSACGTYRYNPRLLEEWGKQEAKRELNAEAGRRSAEKRAATKSQQKPNGNSTGVALNPTGVEKTATEIQLITTTITNSTNVEGTAASAAAPTPKLKASRGGKQLLAESPLGDYQSFAAAWAAAAAANPATYAPFAGVNLAHYHAALLDWSAANAQSKADWLATIRGAIRRDADEGKMRRAVVQTQPAQQARPAESLNHEFIAQQQAKADAAFQAHLARHSVGGALTQPLPCSQTR